MEARGKSSFFLTLRTGTWGAMAHPIHTHTVQPVSGVPESDRNPKSQMPSYLDWHAKCQDQCLRTWIPNVRPPLPPLPSLSLSLLCARDHYSQQILNFNFYMVFLTMKVTDGQYLKRKSSNKKHIPNLRQPNAVWWEEEGHRIQN